MDKQPELFEKRYRIIRQIGAGGMGVVYEAEDLLLNKIVAIKTMRRGILSGEHIMRFDREAKALAALNHPNLVSLFIFGVTDENEPYMVMRMESGVPLSDLIEKERLPVEKAVKIFIQICQAMQHAHDRLVLHRDLKPSNILVKDAETKSPNAVVIDFGIAMVDTGNAIDALTKTGVLVGTPAYMSPEQVKGQEIDCRSDIYSLGCIMFEMLTGVQPFTAHSALEVLGRKISKVAPPLNSAAPQGLTFSSELEQIVKKCLAMSVGDRYSSMLELKSDLEQLEGLQTRQVQFVSKAKAKRQKQRLNRYILFVAVLAVPSVVMIFSIFFWKTQTLSTKPVEVSTILDRSRVRDESVIPSDMSVFGHCDDKEDRKPVPQIVVNGKRVVLPENTTDLTALAQVREAGRNNTLQSVEFDDAAISGAFFLKCTEIPITRVIMKGCAVDDSGLKGISASKNMESLDVRSNRDAISAAGLRFLKKAKSLRKLTLQECGLDVPQMEEISNLTQVTELDVSNNAILEDLSMPAISKMSNLTRLVLDNAHIGGEGLAKYISQLKNLKSLSIKGLIVGDDNIAPLMHMKLESLNVENTAITEKGLAALAKIKTLRNLEPSPASSAPIP